MGILLKSGAIPVAVKAALPNLPRKGETEGLITSNHCSHLADGKVKPEPEDLPIFIKHFIKLSGERLEDLRL